MDTAQKGDFEVLNSDDLRYGGIGGLSELLGWTNVQRERSSGFLGGGENIIKAVSDGELCCDWGPVVHARLLGVIMFMHPHNYASYRLD